MKKKLMMMVLATMLMLALVVTASAATLYYVTANNVRVRSGPGTDYDILFHNNRGAKVYVERMTNGWAVVKLAGAYNQDGYISTKYLSRTKPGSNVTPSKTSTNTTPQGDYKNFTAAAYNVIVNPTNNYVNMRWEASKTSQVRKVYYYGAKLTVIAENAYWCQVMDESTGEVGFMLKSLLLRVEEEKNG